LPHLSLKRQRSCPGWRRFIFLPLPLSRKRPETFGTLPLFRGGSRAWGKEQARDG